ncbi:MAG: ATP-binding cassette domain-containing protein [Coriobacteriia bacterium]|nr:ATP-binding cassette domain-containing protein [Coriobacteriia bacterium]
MTSPETACIIRARGLSKQYGNARVVNALNMNVHAGDIYGFVGRNGAGKSTTMKLICGLTRASEGELQVLGHDLARWAGPTGVGSLIEAPGLLEKASALDNLLYKAYALGIEQPRPKCEELLKLVGLSNTGTKQARNFSLGMKQRLGIALALVGEPKLLLLDEPFNGLDPAATHEMREALQKLNKEQGLTIVVSSHVLDQLNRFATRFGVIDAGTMVVEFDAEHMNEMAAGYIRVRCTDMAKAAQTLAAALPEAQITSANDGALLLPGTEGNLGKVSFALYNANLQVLELVRTQHDIEEFFLELMGKPSNS